MNTKRANNEDNNSIDSLTDMMFTVMERLQDPKNDIEKEIKRSTAMTNAANVIVNAQKARLDVLKLKLQMSKNDNGNKRLGTGSK